MSHARNLQDLYAYNTWANAQVFTVCRKLDQAQLDENAPGTYGTLLDTLKHLAQVEDAYAHMLREESRERMGSPAEYDAHDLVWFEARVAQLGREYAELLASAGESFYEETLDVPWFDFRLTKRDGLLQVLTHSTQHRSQVMSTLGERGQEVPNLDYVYFIETRGASPK